MDESLTRHARGMAGYGDLADESARVLAALRYAATVIGTSAAGALELAMLAAHVAEMRAELAHLATTELAVTAIYEAGRRDEREAIEAARIARRRRARVRSQRGIEKGDPADHHGGKRPFSILPGQNAGGG